MTIPLFNRELSWLEFNRRVLAEAETEDVPLLERAKFLSITATNLDEFLMVRVGGIRQLIESGIRERSMDGLTPKQQLKAIRDRVKALQRDMYRVYDSLMPKLRAAGVRIDPASVLTKKQQAVLAEEFHARVAPILTPLAVDPGHPLPFLASGSLNLAIILASGVETYTAFLKIPKSLPRFVSLSPRRFLPVEELIRLHASYFFPGLEVREVVPFRVIRNADIALREDEVQDLLKSVETELRMRERKEVVWMEVARTASDQAVALLQRELDVVRDDVFLTPGLPKLGDLIDIYGRVGDLQDEPYNPRIPVELATHEDMFSIIRTGDILLHRPYDSYTAVVEFVQSAADDPDVIAIKQTLYRTETGSVIVDALARAAEKGKQVAAIVEVQARFDEERNIAWARRLEEAGVQVVYGLVGVKTHSKICLVIRREGGELRRYVHLSTGNYNAKTARLYTDIDLLTADAAIAEDAAQLLNLVTGYSAETAQELFAKHSREWRWKKLVPSPMEYHAWTLRMIDRETKHAREKRPAQIIAKMNSLVDSQVIEALYRAADAGVKIDLIVRGICCLVPRENIRVMSIIDRFLEHSRIFLFRNGGSTEIYAASGDWMPRNFFRRIEVTWPILSPRLRDRIELQILGTCLADDAKAWRLMPDGTYRRRKPGPRAIRSQQRFIDIARAEAVKLPSYDEAVKKPAQVRRKAKRK
ncbi:MAG TPA: polyphosphate kinase 1 [Thermoanaerobaculia bacterium]|jgi:polyphosphate kinase|nr:polyphosphate kinase 1 [Thermoanaerobaculia bacterium]